ncbi:MAG TPA: gamma-glutamylcyclotransferase family protein [Geothrix sp.]|nr:gamma-glutamylcyclotransferase family protein [Geothrix sp.]
MLSDGLFVYGTLREGGANHAWLLRTHPEGLTGAWVAGRLFHLPAGYPALVPGPEPVAPPPGPGWVRGEFVGYEDDQDLESALADLDPLEGVEEDLFTREILPVTLEGGQRYQAWVYLFHVERLPRLEREAVELTDGDWASYL